MSEWFSNPKPNLYVSDAGFSVEVLGQTGIRYREVDRSAFVDSEVMNEPDTILIYERSIKKWDPPYESDPLDDRDRAKIVDGIRKAFEFKGYRLQVI
jgi:Immunity protein 74